MSLSFGSQTSGGSQWLGEIYFDPNADTKEGSAPRVKKGEIISKLKKLLEDENITNEKITNVWVYKTPLISNSLSNVLLYHSFVVYETKSWWWSIEKNSEGITIQRGYKLSSVKDNYRQKPRKTTLLWWKPIELIHDTGRKTIGELVDFLAAKNVLNDRYDLTLANCKHFAKILFDEVPFDH